jgi:hypothetical protein
MSNYCLDDPPISINGKKTAAKKLGKHIEKKLSAKIWEDHDFDLPKGLWVLLQGLKCVWKWKEDQREVFWLIFWYLAGKLVTFWTNNGPPVIDNKEFTKTKPWKWNVDTW